MSDANKPSLHYLGFDFGMKRIGSAIGQTITQTASPLGIIAAKDGIPNWGDIDKLIEDWHPQAIILGIPLNMDGTEQQITFCARKFGNRLRNRYKLPVHEVDERLTTKEAKSRIIAHGGMKALEKTKLDAVAAQVILEAWLAEHQQSW